ncbi:uncharacterized protein LOC129949162 [Eupeodes corollae]|uniref:uncharacterized protein LOC129949162 n=1 Tax=Eupeodes corollae TaxID=290404 RepID=UPI002493BC5B|nr:uncharacterized protein LOC129949162 [Eupeodes corollae]
MKSSFALNTALFLFTTILVDIVVSSQLDDFLQAIEEAKLKLGLGQIRPKRSHSIDEILSRFSEDEDESSFYETNLQPGDAWYKSYRELECYYGGDCSKRRLKWKPKIHFNQKTNDYYEEQEEEDESSLEDQWERTQNDLSHEANYKLSKAEQDAAEQKLPKVAWPIQHSNTKRHVDPMKAIRMKTSLKMMEDGYGLTLPSSFLDEDRQKITVEDILSNSQNDDDDNPDPWKESYDVLESRKLLSFDESDDSPNIGEDKICHVDKLPNLFKRKSEAETNNTATLIRPKTLNLLNSVDKERNVNNELHIDVNGTVLRNDELLEESYKNNTIGFEEKLTEYGISLDRNRREVVFPTLNLTSKSKTKDEIKRPIIEALHNFPLDEIKARELTSQLIHSIFSFVKSTPNLNIPWTLSMKSKEHLSEMQRVEIMLRQAMETINATIEHQVRTKTSVSLRTDEKVFYNYTLPKTLPGNNLTPAEDLQLTPKHPRTEEISIGPVQLKTSLRIFKNDGKPTQPSLFLDEDRHKSTVEDTLLNSEHDGDKNTDLLKEIYKMMKSRKLVSAEDSDHAPIIEEEKICYSKNFPSHGVNMNQCDNITQKTDLDPKQKEISFENATEKRISRKRRTPNPLFSFVNKDQESNINNTITSLSATVKVKKSENKELATSSFKALSQYLDDTQIRQKFKITKNLPEEYEEIPQEYLNQISKIKESLLLAFEQLKELERSIQKRKRQTFSSEIPTEDLHFTPQSLEPINKFPLIDTKRNIDEPTLALDEDQQKISVEDILLKSQNEDDRIPDSWKDTYEVLETRKLLSIEEDSEDTAIVGEEAICRTKDCLNHGMDTSQFDNLNQKTDLDRKLEGISFDNVEENKVSKKGVLDTLSDQLMNSEAFVKLQNFIKGINEAGSSNKTTTSTTTIRPKTTIATTTKSLLNFVNKDRDVNIKLRMSVNATVLGNSKLPEEFHKNNTITFKPAIMKTKQNKKPGLIKYDEADLERNTRGVVFPIFTSTSKRKAKPEISKAVVEASDNFPLDEIITGKLTSQLVNTIFSSVKSSPHLKILWPGLMKNKVSSPKQVQNFYAIRNHDNESEMQRTEIMLRQAMETINAIIEQQVRSRSCIPLRADLRAFYNLILQTQAEKNQLEEYREKRETLSSEDLGRTLDDSQIRQKSRIVKKLLKDYEELPSEDQDRVSNIKESLLLEAEELKELKEISRRRKRQNISKLKPNLLNQNSNTSSSALLQIKTPTEDLQLLTPQYIKLAKTAEMLSHNSPKDSDLTIDFDSV